MTIKVHVINAFTANDSGGNPAGVVLHADGLNAGQMLAIAAEVRFSETAFISHSTMATYNVHFFTPTEEVDLCGHATIASWSLLYQQKLCSAGDYTQETLAGLLGVTISNDGLVYMEQAHPQFFEKVDVSEIASVLGISEHDFENKFKPQVVSTGLKDLIIMVQDEAILAKIKPQFSEITALSKKHDVTGLHVACLHDRQASVATVRNFAPRVGIAEEAATGTSNGALLCYLQQHGALLITDSYRIDQGKSMSKLSCIYGKFKGQTVWVGGYATINGELVVDV